MKGNYLSEIKEAEKAVIVATQVFNQAEEPFIDSAIYELLAAELRLNELLKESELRITN